MNRRKFLLQTGALIPGAVLSNELLAATPKAKYKMGIQLFSVRAPLAADLKGTIKALAEVGYEDSETYGYDPGAKTYYNIPAKEFRQLLTDNKMITTSGHYDFTKYFDASLDQLMEFVDSCVVGANALGQKYITWPWLDPEHRTIEHFKKLSEKLNRIGEQINKAGLGFAYHNHDFEFAETNGENGYDIVMKNTDPALVKLQLDLYWVMHSSKLSPAELIAKQPGRFVMWHVKDMDKKTRDYSELGNGSIDYTKILPESKKAGLQYYYIEQGGNFAVDPLKSVIDSARFFKANLEKYLK